MKTTNEPDEPRVSIRRERTAAKSFGRAANWSVGIAAGILVLLSAGGYVYHREQLAALAADHLRLIVTGPSGLQSGADADYAISTRTISGQPVPAQVDFSLLGSDGKRLKTYKETADEQGRLQVSIPADLRLPAQARLRVVAWRRDSREEVEAPLVVEPAVCVTRLATDQPRYRPGDTIRYRSLTLTRFGLTPERETPIRFALLDPSGATVYGSSADATTERGVGSGAFPIPKRLSAGRYTLVARGRDGAFPDARRTIAIEQDRAAQWKKTTTFARDAYAPGAMAAADFRAERAEGGPAAGARLRIVATVDGRTVFQQDARANDAGSMHLEFMLPEKIERGEGRLSVTVGDGEARETLVRDIPIDTGRVVVAFQPEGGELAAGLENRVYFAASDPRGRPANVKGVIVSDDGGEVAAVRTTYAGMGVFSFTPLVGQAYRLRIQSPAGVKDEPRLPAAVEREVTLTAGAGVFEVAKPLELNVRAVKPGIPLVVAAYCRSVQVGQQPMVTQADAPGGNPVVVPLDATVGGVIRATVFDYSVTPPKAVAERLVYRRPARKLVERASPDRETYQPGKTVNVAVTVTDERGVAVPAALGAAVVDDAVLKRAGNCLPTVPTWFLLAGEIKRPEDIEGADFYLSDATRDGVTAATALDLLLGMGGRPQAVEPPIMLDNLESIRADYEKSLADYQGDRTNALNTLTTATFFGGLGLVLLVAMLGLMRIVAGMHLWIPAIGATTCCLILGAILMDPGRLATGQATGVVFEPYHTGLQKPGSVPNAPTASPDRKPSDANADVSESDGPGDLGGTLYWNPLLIAAADGKATIRFDLPNAAGTFRLTVDAHGDARIGAGRAEIVSHELDKAETKRPSPTAEPHS